MYKALNGMVPSYISYLITKKSSSKSSLRSNDLLLLVVPREKFNTFGDHAFAYAGPSMWNKLPKHIQMAPNLYSFKRKPKTFLF